PYITSLRSKSELAHKARKAHWPEQGERQGAPADPRNSIARAIKQDHDNECLPGFKQQQKSDGHQRAGRNHRPDRVIALAEQALDHARADLRRSEYGAEGYRCREVTAR